MINETNLFSFDPRIYKGSGQQDKPAWATTHAGMHRYGGSGGGTLLPCTCKQIKSYLSNGASSLSYDNSMT